jgi:actin related protein 2/3 complex subunit 1A/1B
VVSALDWHPLTNKLLSCSTDRGIIVWEMDKISKKLGPTLVSIRELKSNLDAVWNARGDKFCVGASSGHVFVGNYDPVN